MDGEAPLGGSITAFFGTVKFDGVHTLVESDGVVQFLGFSTFPNTLDLLLHDLSVNHREASVTEVNWSSEGVFSTVHGDWEYSSVVESNVFALFALTDSLV